MQNQDNIEKLFKDTFQNFEADVNPSVWSNVQSGLGSGAGSAGAAGAAAGKFALGKIIAAVVVSASVIGGGIWYMARPERKIETVAQNNPAAPIETTPLQEEKQNIVSENTTVQVENRAEHPGAQAPPAVRMLNHDVSDRAGETKNVSQEAAVAGASNQANESSASQTAPKYGNASKGDGGMMRGAPGLQSTAANREKDNSHGSQEGAEVSSVAADIFVNTSSGDAPLTVRFSNHGTASSATWNFDDGTGSTDNSPTHVFEKAGKYEVTLVASGASESVSDKITIEVKSISGIGEQTGNIFTPNGDGNNETFFFGMKNIATIGVVIFSQKTNQLVAKWNVLDGFWDGKMLNGEPAPEGVYYYAIQAIGTDGVAHSKNGMVTLTR